MPASTSPLMKYFLFRPSISIAGSILIVAGLIGWFWFTNNRPQTAAKTPQSLLVYCAAGLKAPIELAAAQYQKLTGTSIQLQYGGSQTLLANLEISHRGDLYLPADDSYLDTARKKNLLAETIPLARMQLVVGVRKGNPKHLTTLDDLLRPDVRLAQGDPDAAAIGHVARETLQKAGKWDDIQGHTAVIKLTVNDVANDLKIGAVDAGFLWDAVLAQYPELEAVTLPVFTNAQASITVAVVQHSAQPSLALRFARFLGAPEHGLLAFKNCKYQVLPGDQWAERPELTLYSGAVNRLAVEETIDAFEKREGVRINRIFNGCGILVGQMKAGGRPDAYLTCDASFVLPVADLFLPEAVPMSRTEIIILAPKGNPQKINGLADLGQSGLRIGVANPEQSTLGALTQRLLDKGGIREKVMRNVVTQTPTADLLVNQMRAGSLDAVVVYAANVTKVRELFEVVKLGTPEAIAVQTFSVGKESKYPHLAGRLRLALQSAESHARYRSVGFELPPDAK